MVNIIICDDNLRDANKIKSIVEKYMINVILDNCTDETARVLEISSGTRLWRLNSEDGMPVGKAEAIKWFFDLIFINDKSDAFVFLSGDCTIRPDFLVRLNEKINKLL